MKGFTNDYADQRWGIFIAFALGYIILVEIVSAIAGLLERRWKVA
jgi:glutamate transport system permease protein